MRLQGKVAIITGAGTGIGEAIALKFAREGAAVLVAGLPDDPVEDVTQRILEGGGKAASFKGDLAEEPNAKACVATAVKSFGKLNVLVNNAGVLDVAATVDAFPVEKFDAMIRNNLRTAFLMTKHSIPHLQKTLRLHRFSRIGSRHQRNADGYALWRDQVLSPCLHEGRGARAGRAWRARELR